MFKDVLEFIQHLIWNRCLILFQVETLNETNYKKRRVSNNS